MSAPVDVLAVLDRAFGAANEHYDDLKSATDEPALGPAYQRACRYMAEHREARAAVAELIEAATRLRDRAEFEGFGREANAEMSAVSTALARVKGGAA
ncbi:MAG: hypothetical protein DI543_27825 [Bradyrhizobium icense]|uniref:hypothetical protein n=1 Tax=Stenotrophomonas sp. RG-453 TaxID=2957502 RepID=UPI00120A1200|nr:hypothetical protein [Stenotrophomonas sp. RG-453]MDX5515854.1 hypothetical protein [Stenotrophomonas sp. RG-453]TKW71506.1 MAG: hypothetical protein DI543_27825 [Bradyrhizobium icense]